MERFIRSQVKYHPHQSPAELIYRFYQDVVRVNKNLMTYQELAQKWNIVNQFGYPMSKQAWMIAHRLFDFVVVAKESTMDKLKFRINITQMAIDDERKIYGEFVEESIRLKKRIPNGQADNHKRPE